jgi:hypothetical protein
MKNRILRFVIIVLIITLAASLIVGGVGLALKWTNPLQFSNGLFIGGAILLVIGTINLMQSHNSDGNSSYAYSRTNQFDRDEGFKLRMQDIARGYNQISFLGVSTLLLWAISALIGLSGK